MFFKKHKFKENEWVLNLTTTELDLFLVAIGPYDPNRSWTEQELKDLEWMHGKIWEIRNLVQNTPCEVQDPSGETNQIIECKDCKNEFQFSAGEAAYYKEKRFDPPRRCRECREVKKAEKASRKSD